MEREKEQMLREKEELMLRLQDYEQKTKKAERGGPTIAQTWLCPQRQAGSPTRPRGAFQSVCLSSTRHLKTAWEQRHRAFRGGYVSSVHSSADCSISHNPSR